MSKTMHDAGCADTPDDEMKQEVTESSRFKTWLTGTKDPYIGHVEMKRPEEEPVKEEIPIDERLKEKVQIREDVYAYSGEGFLSKYRILYRIAAVVFCLLLVATLLLTVSYMPKTGSATNPVNNEVPEKYIEEGLQDTGATNIVAGMILDYRAFDTLGESHVLFVATITVIILMRIDKKKKMAGDTDPETKEQAEINDRIYEPKNDAILQFAARFLVPLIMIFGIYVVLNGHLSPGGGFSGGAIIGAGLILYLNAFGFEKTERFFTEKTFKRISFVSLAFYALAKCYSFFMGANHLDNHIPKGIPGHILSGGLILPLNIAVGCVVACTMYAFYALFRKGGF